ncbi:TetR/AcrR family transcriptional regulator [Spiractinospora alimapuensis]|uniref:TetR/AcrR family transcriptional regulator n=1 Tax=Spiractinospora alimapuensis TaxID=2820884 RepID=UPI001F2591F2|nr:TetR/AcrR family transcriptional regulator [Spiractinospora alimapuensis]QVQ50765.1 TetR/AcrR family transcriptional regulator [Spiractinospora alimapuensis]
MVQQTEHVVTPTRDRILRATVDLLRRQGYEGTGVKQIARAAEATLGSLYHFFPEGKEQLATEALRMDGEHYASLLRRGMESSTDPAEGIVAFADLLAADLRAANWCDSCMASAAALERIGHSPAIQAGYQAAMETWREIIATRLRAAGTSEEKADDAACFALSALEGAEIQSRTTQSDHPLRTAGTYLAALFRGLARE